MMYAGGGQSIAMTMKHTNKKRPQQDAAVFFNNIKTNLISSNSVLLQFENNFNHGDKKALVKHGGLSVIL